MPPWRLWLLTRRAVAGFAGAGGTRLAAAIAYYALLSLFPLVILLVAAGSLVLDEATVRERIADRISGALPLTESGAADVRDLLADAGGSAAAVGLAGLAGLLWSASGMMGALRAGVTAVSGPEPGRPFLRGKLIDLGMIAGVGILLLASAAITVTARVAREQVLEPIGVPGAGTLIGILVPIALATATLLVLIRLVPAAPPSRAGAWRAAPAGGVALWALATGFGLYVANFGRYNAIYGSLGTIVALMVFVGLVAIVVLLAAAAAAAWEDVARARPPEPSGDGEPLWRRARGALAGLFVRR
jgi:membrane protein